MVNITFYCSRFMKLRDVFVHGILFSKWFTTEPAGINKRVRKMNVLDMLLSTTAVTETLSANCALSSLRSVFRHLLDVQAKVWRSICICI